MAFVRVHDIVAKIQRSNVTGRSTFLRYFLTVMNLSSLFCLWQQSWDFIFNANIRSNGAPSWGTWFRKLYSIMIEIWKGEEDWRTQLLTGYEPTTVRFGWPTLSAVPFVPLAQVLNGKSCIFLLNMFSVFKYTEFMVTISNSKNSLRAIQLMRWSCKKIFGKILKHHFDDKRASEAALVVEQLTSVSKAMSSKPLKVFTHSSFQ